MGSWLKKYGWIIGGGLLFLALKVPALFDPFTYGDEGIYLTLGLAARKGLVWYRDIHDNKPPLLYLIAALSGNFFTYRVIHVVWSLVTVAVFWLATKLVYPESIRAQKTATLAFVVLTSLPLFEGNVGNAENFMLLPTVAGFYLLYEWLTAKVASSRKTTEAKRLTALFSRKEVLLPAIGSIFGTAALFKIPAAFDFAAALVLSFVFLYGSGRDLRQIAYRLLLMTVGFCLPLAASVGYYFREGAGREYLTAAFAQNLPYLSSWQTGGHQTAGLPIGMMGRLWLVAAVVVGVFLLRNYVRGATKLVLIWFAFSWLAALLSSRPYPHYLLQLVPPVCLALGLAGVKGIAPAEKKLPLFLLFTTTVTFFGFGFWQYPVIKYYSRFYRFAATGQAVADYRRDFDPTTPYIYEAAAFIRQRTFPDEKIFIWGTLPSIYALSERLPVGRYTASYHINDFGGKTITKENLLEQRPRYIIADAGEPSSFPELAALVQNEYALEKIFGHIKIYHRLK